jgi:pimeloyl-ACP methyl ester carboxylesterase
MTDSASRAADPVPRKLRVLCLHGFHGSGAILREQMKPLFGGLEPIAEFVCIDAPSLAAGSFGWWQQGFAGWEQTRDWLVRFFATQQHFDGIFGFSQGAALTSLLVGLRTPSGRVSGQRPLSFEFALMAGGFRSDSPIHADLYATRDNYEFPSVHIMGNSDVVVPIADSRILARQFASPVVLEHPGGHIIASTPPTRQAVARFLADMAARRSNNCAAG